MNIKRVRPIFLLSILIPATAIAEQYLCIADLSTGFSYDSTNKKWRSVDFNVDDSKYMISESDITNMTYKITKIGQSYVSAWCEDDFIDSGTIFCEFGNNQFRFNRESGRFIMSSASGYYYVTLGDNIFTDENSATPFIEIGKCSSF